MSNTATEKIRTEMAGDWKLYVVELTSITSASETVTLTLASHGIREIKCVLGAFVTEGQDANLQTAHVTFSNLVLTVATLNAAGGAATNWDSAKVTVVLLAR